MIRHASILCAAIVLTGSACGVARANEIVTYGFSIEAATYDGVTYPHVQFSVSIPTTEIFSRVATVYPAVDFDGLTITTIGISSNDGLGGGRLQMNFPDVYRAPAGQVVGLFTPDIPFGTVGTFGYNATGNAYGDPGYVLLVSDGCMSSVCGTGWNALYAGGVVTIFDTPEPGALALFVFGLLGLAWSQRRIHSRRLVS